MKILITGASGLYGSKLAELASEGNEVYSVHNQHEANFGIPIRLDISDKNQVESTFENVNPDVVVHAATLTDVDRCETEKELAWRINVEGTENIIKACKISHTFVVYISTDYVFNGEKGCYSETEVPDPINYYGYTKLKAEELVESLVNNYSILRTSVIYGAIPAAGKTNFVLWLLNKLQGKESVRVVTDQWNSPTLNTNLAKMSLEIIEKKLVGIYHLSGATRISRYDFAKQVAQVFNLDDDLIMATLSAEFSWPAKRPRDSSLNVTKAKQELRNKPLELSQALQELKGALRKFAE